jgi:DNA (cytosine-5)-methyltransferase 1
MQRLGNEGRAPSVVVLENVCGALASHAGTDFAAIGAAVVGGEYRWRGGNSSLSGF